MKYKSLFVTGALLVGLLSITSAPVLIKALQLPSGWLAAFFLGAPFSVDGALVRIFTSPNLTVSEACSGIRFFMIITAIGGGYWCGSKIRRWLLLLPATYFIALFANAARISMAWRFRRISVGFFPEWFQEYAHMGIGIICFLSVLTGLFYWINRKPACEKEAAK